MAIFRSLSRSLHLALIVMASTAFVAVDAVCDFVIRLWDTVLPTVDVEVNIMNAFGHSMDENVVQFSPRPKVDSSNDAGSYVSMLTALDSEPLAA